MKIQKVEIKNFKHIDYKSIDLAGKNIFILGPNASGKTSFIDACFLNMPTQPLKSGAGKGEVELTVDDYVINYQFSAKNQTPKLTIFDKSGQPQKAPAGLLKDLFGVKDFNIEHFLSLPDSKKIEQLKKLLEIDFTDLDDQYKQYFDERTFINRQLKEYEAKSAGETFELKYGTEKVDLTPIYQAIENASKDNSDIERIKNGIDQFNATITSNNERINKLKLEIEQLEKENDALSVKVLKGRDWLADKMPVDVTALNAELQEKIEHNQRVDKNLQIQQNREKERELYKKVEELTAKMENIKEVKKRELEANPLPVKGLVFDDERLLLDGLPFESDQINTARKIIAGLEIQYHLLGEVKIAKFEGSLLDNNSIQYVVDWAKERDIQLFVEIMDRNIDGIKYEIQEG